MTDKDFPYADILHLPHHRAAGRAHMSLYDRAAQFAPFAALTGFDGVIAETGRQTERRIELSESERALCPHRGLAQSSFAGRKVPVCLRGWHLSAPELGRRVRKRGHTGGDRGE